MRLFLLFTCVFVFSHTMGYAQHNHNHHGIMAKQADNAKPHTMHDCPCCAKKSGKSHMAHDHAKMMETGSMHHQPLAHLPQGIDALEANKVMHRDMDIVFTGDADIDFFKGMIPHHQGAIDMAQVVLKYGENSQVKRLR
jgi:uncharacterized protein (DUF305 family)